MIVRELEPDEWQVWRDLRLRALVDSPDAYGRVYEIEVHVSDEEWERRHVEGGRERVALVAELDGRPAAIAAAHVFPEDPGVAWFFAAWVAPEARRHGIGRQLIDRAEAWARSRSASAVMLHVTEGNDAAQALYESCGFVPTGLRVPLRDDSPLQTIEMRKRLVDA